MANVNFYRDTKANIDNVAYTDGQMYFPTDQNKIYLDTGNQRKQYGGDTEVDSALSTTSENPVQNKVVTTDLNQKVAKTDVVNDLASAVAVTATNVPAGCGTVKELKQDVDTLNDSLGGLQFGVDENGNYGYIKAGADSVTPFSSNGLIASGRSEWNCVAYNKALAITKNNPDLCTISGNNIIVNFSGSINILAFHTEPSGINNCVPYIKVYKNGTVILSGEGSPAGVVNSTFSVNEGDTINISAYNSTAVERITKNGFMMTRIS